MSFASAALELLQTQREATLAGRPRTGAKQIRKKLEDGGELIAELSTGCHNYASTQVELPVEVSNQILAMGKRVAENHLYKLEDTPHITVLYGIHEDDVEPLKSLLADFGPVQVFLGKTSLFAKGEGPDVVKVDVESPDLRRLRKTLEKLPHTTDFPEYQPHVTVAYVGPGDGPKYVGMSDVDGKSFVIQHLTFSEQSGRKHTIWLGGGTQDMSTWREDLHPRGQPDNAGEFASKGQQAPAASHHEVREEAKQKVSALLNADHNKHIHPFTKTAYEAALHDVLNHFTPQMVKAMLPQLGSIQAYRSCRELTDDVFPGERLMTGGTWGWNHGEPTGLLRIDGDAPGSITRYEIYSHELGHCLDWEYRHSRTPEWQEAWKEEIDTAENPLSKYARVDPEEGFAEYVRLFGQGHMLEAKLFPKCYACLRKWGYV